MSGKSNMKATCICLELSEGCEPVNMTQCHTQCVNIYRDSECFSDGQELRVGKGQMSH